MRTKKLLAIAKQIQLAFFAGEPYEYAKYRLAGDISPSEFALLDEIFDELD